MAAENELSRTDLETLIEAVEAWENKDLAGSMMGDLVGALLVPKDAPPELRAKVERDTAERKEKDRKAKQERKDVGVVLRAKLIGIRDGLVVPQDA